MPYCDAESRSGLCVSELKYWAGPVRARVKWQWQIRIQGGEPPRKKLASSASDRLLDIQIPFAEHAAQCAEGCDRCATRPRKTRQCGFEAISMLCEHDLYASNG